MSIDFSKLKLSGEEIIINPRDIFMSLPSKEKEYMYPRDVQTEVWKQWFEKRNNKNLIIKMNTGSGKTIVGLLILQSCLNEGKGPAVYVVPDNFLVSQVCNEAKKLGISVACDDGEVKGEEDYNFRMNKAILVTNIYKLVNGKSIFGQRQTNNIKIGSITIDDVHACLDVIEKQHTISIDSSSELYTKITNIILKHNEAKKNNDLNDIIKFKDPRYNYLVPFWIWQKENNCIYELICNPQYSNEDIMSFKVPLMRDNWKTANCVISANAIEITLKGIPIDKITSFEEAERRIFMSATLADDSVFVSTMGLKDDFSRIIITPEKVNDIGERLIIFPELLNPSIKEDDIKHVLKEKSKQYNVVVIVPSFERVSFWKDIEPDQVLSSKDGNLESGIEKLKNGELIGLSILVNKYDGIDLPDNSCRILVIDGLPNMRNSYDTVIQGIDSNNKRIYRDQAQKIEQGMGRGVRSYNDYCAVVLMGKRLVDVIINQKGKEFFSMATLKQLELSKQIWDQLISEKNNPNVSEIFALLDYVLKRNDEWISVNKSHLASIAYDNIVKIDSTIMAMRKAFEEECKGNYNESYFILQDEVRKTNDLKTKGLLMQYMAEYKNFIDPVNAQELLCAATEYNPMAMKPIEGIQFSKMISSKNGQVQDVIQYLSNYSDKNGYILHVEDVLDKLTFSAQTANIFEKAINDVFEIIGISASRPEKQFGGKAPDNLLAIGNGEYIIIECKNGSTVEEISKSDCAQLLSSIQWFKTKYLHEKYIPVLIHNSNIFGKEASPSPDMKIMTPKLLENFKSAVRKFAVSIINGDFTNNNIEKQLKANSLLGKQIFDSYTDSFLTR